MARRHTDDMSLSARKQMIRKALLCQRVSAFDRSGDVADGFSDWNNRINRLSYDFVVGGRDSTVIAAIELDDSTHSTRARALTDQKQNKASADAGLCPLRWHVSSLPSEEAIRQEIIALMPTASTALEPDGQGILVGWNRAG